MQFLSSAKARWYSDVEARFVAGKLSADSDEFREWRRSLTEDCPTFSKLESLDSAGLIDNGKFPFLSQLSSGDGPAFLRDNMPWYQWLQSMEEFFPIPIPLALMKYLSTLSEILEGYYRNWPVDNSPEAFLPDRVTQPPSMRPSRTESPIKTPARSPDSSESLEKRPFNSKTRKSRRKPRGEHLHSTSQRRLS